jgi:signal transduction histidine kinase/ActR/RegA family two-component response regulator
VGRLKKRRDTMDAERSPVARRQRKRALKTDLGTAMRARQQGGGVRAADPMGLGALLGAPTPIVLVEGAAVAFQNHLFQELARKNARASWKRIDAGIALPQKACRGLTRLLLGEVAAFLGAREESVTCVYMREGREEYLEASYWRLPRPDKTKQVMVLIREATARVHAELEIAHMREALIQHERMRAIGELASGVAHDLNNTLHAMNLRLSLIEQSEVCRTAQGNNIAALSRAINDGALVVGRLQDFARQQAEPSLDSVDVPAVVTEAVEMVRTTIEGESSLDGAPVRIRTRLPPLPAVTALAPELRHVIVNLLLNARDAMPRGGTIELVAEQKSDRVVLEVVDDGCGIPDKDLENIFSPFFTTKGRRGTGLGLSNARTVLGRLGGLICARNRPGGGACFTLSFPIASLPRSSHPARIASHLPRGKRILVVDDNLDNLQATKMVMELQEQSVDVAQTGSEAIARISAGSRYDLVFCDLGMPDMNGWGIAQEIQKLAPGTTVYMLTGWAQQINEDDPRRQWVKGVLQKPMDPETMRDLLAHELVSESLDPSPGGVQNQSDIV